jgi:hypothetical protein
LFSPDRRLISARRAPPDIAPGGLLFRQCTPRRAIDAGPLRIPHRRRLFGGLGARKLYGPPGEGASIGGDDELIESGLDQLVLDPLQPIANRLHRLLIHTPGRTPALNQRRRALSLSGFIRLDPTRSPFFFA